MASTNVNMQKDATHQQEYSDVEVPYSAIFKQLRHKVARAILCLFRRKSRREIPYSRQIAGYDELTLEDAFIQLFRKLPNKLTERKDRRAQNLIISQTQTCYLELVEKIDSGQKPAAFIFAPCPVADKLNDGYAHRIEHVDNLFAKQYIRIYVCEAEWLPTSESIWVQKINEDHYYIKYKINTAAHLSSLTKLINKGVFVYTHSVLRVYPSLFDSIDIPKILDVHGAVPEEAQMNGNIPEYIIQSQNERYSIEHFDWFVFITNAQKKQLEVKYRRPHLPGTVLPAYNKYSLSQSCVSIDAAPPSDRIHVIYSGGAQRWQMIDLMLDTMRRCSKHQYSIYTQNIDVFEEYCTAMGLSGIEVCYVPLADIPQKYSQAHYGFVLREDVVVNNVAGPTKLTEYCAYGIVPILNTPNIGDFAALGMQYITVGDFLQGRLPDETKRKKIATDNFEVSKKLLHQYTTGQMDIQNYCQDILLAKAQSERRQNDG